MPRLFVGTFLSDEGVEKLANLAQVNQHLSEHWNAKIRWVDRTKFHITWVFLGEIETAQIPHVINDLKAAIEGSTEPRQPLKILYDRIELWPNERKPRLAVATTSTVSKEVLNLDATIKKALSKFLKPEQSQHELKVFKPHITILRFPRDHHHEKEEKTKATEIQVPQTLFPIRHEITEISLIESELGKHVDGYCKLATFLLRE